MKKLSHSWNCSFTFFLYCLCKSVRVRQRSVGQGVAQRVRRSSAGCGVAQKGALRRSWVGYGIAQKGAACLTRACFNQTPTKIGKTKTNKDDIFNTSLQFSLRDGGSTELVLHYANREISHRRKGATSHLIDMVWLSDSWVTDLQGPLWCSSSMEVQKGVLFTYTTMLWLSVQCPKQTIRNPHWQH